MKFVVALLLSLNLYAAEHDLCSTALYHVSNCLALQSDFNDSIDLAGHYGPNSNCIDGVKFYGGILRDDARLLRETYQVKNQSKQDPLERSSETGANMTVTQYCAGDISLLVNNKLEEISIVFYVKESVYHGDPKPEITIEF